MVVARPPPRKASRPRSLAPPPPLWPECLSSISCHLPPPRHRRARDPQGAAAASPHLVGRGPSSTAISPHRHPLRAGRAREERLTDQLDPRARSTSPPRPSSSPSSPRTSRSPTSRNPAAAPRTDRDRDSTLKWHCRRTGNHRWVRGPRSTRADSSHFVPPPHIPPLSLAGSPPPHPLVLGLVLPQGQEDPQHP